MDRATLELKKSRAFLCLECGKCTAICPISRFNNSYSPRRLLADGLFYGADNLITNPLLWSCLTCQLCSQRCPVDVKFSEYMRDIRAEACRQNQWGNASHGGALHHIMEMAAAPALKQNRTGWISDNLKVKSKGEVLYFVGCLPYHHDFFAKDFDYAPLTAAVDTVKILNHLGIEPVVLDNERCCGHDLYWLGQLEKFDELGRLNLKEIEQTGAKLVVTSCPECALALKRLYAERLGGVNFTVKHISELVAENIDKFEFSEVPLKVTFQDPCRLGRYLGVYDQPRQAIMAIPGIEMQEMPHSRRGAICCGTTNWMNCDAVSKQIQHSRLTEAKATGAQTLVTACPKCQIHFRCSQCGDESQKVDINITDFVNIVASALEG
ncbi:MAG: (Fe-S)-binding protein [candidate division Zixibacteria bacterium]|nr:(Fe-S)-binding protein [candidate division Zixibacteria bacterium]